MHNTAVIREQSLVRWFSNLEQSSGTKTFTFHFFVIFGVIAWLFLSHFFPPCPERGPWQWYKSQDAGKPAETSLAHWTCWGFGKCNPYDRWPYYLSRSSLGSFLLSCASSSLNTRVSCKKLNRWVDFQQIYMDEEGTKNVRVILPYLSTLLFKICFHQNLVAFQR